jgi:hypothetical protein
VTVWGGRKRPVPVILEMRVILFFVDYNKCQLKNKVNFFSEIKDFFGFGFELNSAVLYYRKKEFTMRKALFLTIIFICLFFLCLGAEKYDLLEVGANIQPKRLSRGQEGHIVLKFAVKDGIMISSQPSFIIEIDPSDTLAFSKDFFTASDLEIEVMEKDGKEYLDLSEPVLVPFTVMPEAERGNHVLEGQVKFFACSIEEGWCLKDKKEFSATFYTSKRETDSSP